jgi:hypothetical protein
MAQGVRMAGHDANPPLPEGSPMSRTDATPPDGYADPHDQLRHDLKSPLTTILGRAQLLSRAIRRSPSLAEEERATMLASTLAVETAVLAMVATIEALGGEEPDG